MITKYKSSNTYSLFSFQHETTVKKLADSMAKVVKLSALQSTTAVKVMKNLRSEVAVASQNEKSQQVQAAAKMFGVAVGDLSHLKGTLTPVLPYHFRMLDISADHLESVMEPSRRRRMIAATEVTATADEILKRTTWAGEKNHKYKTHGYIPPAGKFAR